MDGSFHRLRFTQQKIGSRLKLIAPKVHRKAIALDGFRILPLDGPVLDAPLGADPSGWDIIAPNSYWGRTDLNFLMKTTFTVPDGWDGAQLALHLPLGTLGDIFSHPEGMVYLDGQPVGSADRYHHTIPVDPHFADGRPHEIALHGWTGLAGWPPDPNSTAKLYMGEPQLVERSGEAQAFFDLATTAYDAATHLGPNSDAYHPILDALDSAFFALDTRDPMEANFYGTVGRAYEVLKYGLATAGSALDLDLHGIGHAHMDIAYLWTIDQIRLKNQRTFSNVVRLMEEDPAYRFSQSQPALYEMTARDHPELFERIKAQVSDGRWEPMGATWVECDMNIPGAEALVRQFTLGRGWFAEMFGAKAETPVLWAPDTFGFPAQMPQLMRQSGIEWFVANKLNWNQVNRVPWASHLWEGLDGSRVTAHVLTTPREVQYLPFPTNYKSDLSAAEVLGTFSHANGDVGRALPICYGYGDGGGGPTEELLAKARAYRAMPGMPQFKMSDVRSAMEDIDARRDSLPVWRGEHYLEGHRGVYTSQAWIKRANRRAEAALHEAEALAAMAGTAADLDEAWKLLCLNQFHDIITGTSITAVFEDARRDYEAIRAAAETAAFEAAEVLAAGAGSVLNTAPTSGARIALAADGEGQPVEGGHLHYFEDLPAYSATPLAAAAMPRHPVRAAREGAGAVLENELIRVEIAANGQVRSVTDRATGWEALAPGAGANQFQAFEDRPIAWDAWDIDPHFEDRREVLVPEPEIEVVETGPIRAAVRVRFAWRKSTFSQVIRLRAGSMRVDFVTDIDWHETHTLLKVAFPVAVESDRARYDIQWGNLVRPTTRDSDFDAARFEVPAQKWALLEDDGRGVALLNDCKYGYDIHGSQMRLTLIKSATSPDPEADQGAHRFTYALLPLAEMCRATLDHEAYDLNMPLRVLRGGASEGGAVPFATVTPSGVVLETVRPLADRTIEFRLFEARGEATSFRLVLARAPHSAWRTDFLGTPTGELDFEGAEVSVEIGAYEIVTLRVDLGADA
ncbi:MAG: glycoside hydrolase family 38 C-terminal domain-containing protein [Pseudomonadota bacterium]